VPMCGLMKLRYNIIIIYSSFSCLRVVAKRIKGHLSQKGCGNLNRLGK